MIRVDETTAPNARRRDSGYSPGKEETDSVHSPKKLRLDSIEIEPRADSGDSGVGSPSPHRSSRAWGRRYNRHAELAQLRDIQAALHDLSALYGGQVFFSYRPRRHPNVPGLAQPETNLHIAEKEFDREKAELCQPIKPGYFVQRTGLSPEDILDNRLPDLQSGELAILSNGLAVDLLRMTEAEGSNFLPVTVAKYIFNFLELDVPPVLMDKAINITLEYIGENLRYVDACKSNEEANNFLLAPFVVPDTVSEMVSILEDFESDSVNEAGRSVYPHSVETGAVGSDTDLSVSPRLYGYTSLDNDVFIQDNYLCDVNIVNNGQVETFQISSVQDLTDEGAEGEVCDTSARDQSDLASLVTVQQNIVQSEDDCFSVTAAVFNLETESDTAAIECSTSTEIQPTPQLDTDLAVDAPFVEAPIEEMGDAAISSVRKRSGTRAVHVPAKFRDFTTSAPIKRSKTRTSDVK